MSGIDAVERPLPTFVDTHAHLDEPAFDRDREAVIAAASAAGVTRIVNIGVRPSRWTTTIALARAHPGLSITLGIHPHHADECDGASLDRLETLVWEAGAVAIGEIGLDYFRDGPAPAIQRGAFVAQLELARQLRLPVVIHQRAAESDLIAELERHPDLRGVVLHSFEGTDRLAHLGRERGYAFGVGGLATRASATAVRAVLATVPLALVLLETDAPYLVPARTKERRNVPANIPRIAEDVAPIWGVSSIDLAAATTANADRVFSLRSAAEQGDPGEGIG